MTNRLKMLVIAAFTVALLVPAAATAQDEHSGHDMSQMEMTESVDELRELEGSEFEVGYVNRIIPHHEGALEMAELVVERAPHQEVRDAAGRIIRDQQREIKLLTDFLRDEHGDELERDERQVMPEEMMEMLMDAEPEMAEKLFLLMMREHHQSAIEMGEIALGKAASDVLLDQARRMVESQREEQEQFAGWLEAWYGIDAPEPTGDMMTAAEIVMDDMEMPDAGAGGMSSRERGANVLPVVLLFGLAALAIAYSARRRVA